jgi:apolipoprotein N-acyltransferase
MNKPLLGVAAAILTGIALRFVCNLEPVWWLAWFVPGSLLALSLRFEGWAARGLILLAAAIGVSVNFGYLRSVMPLPPVLIILALQTLSWLLIVGASRRIVLAFRSGWTVLALPVLAVALDTALANFTPDGNFGSLGYTQSDILPIAQIASVFGVGGILFVVMAINSALALALHFRLGLPNARLAYSAVVALFVGTAAFGWWRLQAPPAGQPVAFGIAAIDDYIDDPAGEKALEIWAQYDSQVAALADGGAKIVLLPEKIDVLSARGAEFRQGRLRELAANHGVWLVAGLGVDREGQKRNEAWWYAPDGRLVTNYLKHFMAPPEREFVPGSEYPTNEIDGVRYGVAICKDMHFASLGRGFGARDAAVMLVPAWDFRKDQVYAMNMTKLRGIESGYAIVRAARDGLLTVTDAYGRVIDAAESTAMPGTTLIVKAPVGARVRTTYTRIGDALGWVCLAAALLLIGVTWRRSRVPTEKAPETAPETVSGP